MSLLAELQDEISRVRSSIGPSVVGIESRRGAGSGIVIGKDRILTNAHNVWGPDVRVTFDDGRTVDGTVTAADVDGDIAVVQADSGDAPAIAWDATAAPDIGQPVFAVSNPAGRGLRVTFGIVSGTERSFRGPRGRRIAGSIEHTAPLLPGSSGGPVVDAEGRLLGINTNRLGEGFYLAIPSSNGLRAKVESLGRGEAVKPRLLGVALAPAEVGRHLRRAVGLEEVDGLLVRGVEDDSPAARAGLREGDLIVGAGDAVIADADSLHEAIQSAGDALRLRVLRGADEVELDVSFR